ncbi:MAG: antibiotic biosynthesis monooxygenase [Geodermatophilaceae bacterium]
MTVARTVLPDNRQAFEDWADGIQSRMSDYPGHLGSTMLSPGPGEDEYHIVYRFADSETLHNWEHSEERAQWLAKLEEMVESERFAHVTGLETWFTLPDRADQGPPRWKMVAVTSTVIFALQLPIQAYLLSDLAALAAGPARRDHVVGHDPSDDLHRHAAGHQAPPCAGYIRVPSRPRSPRRTPTMTEPRRTDRHSSAVSCASGNRSARRSQVRVRRS